MSASGSTSGQPDPAHGDDGTHNLLISAVEEYVKEYMSQYDASHDYKHIKRVLGLSRIILEGERWNQRKPGRTLRGPPIEYDETLIVLGALLHDVGDKKYLRPGQDPTTLVRDVLLGMGAAPELADRVQDLALHVSFSTEKKDPDRTRDRIAAIPELAIVQDADRLDAIGAVGVARCFAFTGAKGREDGLDGAIEHFKDKLELLEGMMKTETGRRLARERTERLEMFRKWWESENQGLS